MTSYSGVQKDKSLAIILEILPALFGIFGIGWFYAGNTSVGIIALLAGLGWLGLVFVIALFTGGLACCFTIPMQLVAIGMSSYLLSDYMKKSPEKFG